MPESVEACKESVLEDNPEYSESRAYAICNAMQNRGELSVGDDASHDELLRAAAEQDGDCPEGKVYTGETCVAVEEVDAPASLLNAEPRVMASASPLDTQPIEREELGGDKVAYRNIKLVAEGVWTDSNSETPTLYDEETFENTEPEYDESKHNGPPVNIAHDLHKDGPNAGEPHEASIGGYIEPDSLKTDGEALYGDIILDRATDAGAFADTNLKSSLENGGTAGFSPSVELMPEELRDASHPRAEEHVAAAALSGTGLVRDPASRSVDLQHETQNRAVAMAASGKEVKTLHRESAGMSDEQREAIRAEIMQRSLQMEDMEDDVQNIADELDVPADEVWEVLDPLLDMGEEDEDRDNPEMEEDEDDDEEDDEPDEMQEGDDDVDALQDQVANLAERLEQLEDAMSDTLSEGDVAETREELSAAKDEIEDLREDKKELSQRVEELENIPTESKTLAESSTDEEFDWSDAEDGVSYDPATGSMSR